MFSCEYERCCSQSESSMIARSCFLPPQTGSRGRWSCCSSHPASPPLPSLSLFLWTSLCPTLCLLILKERGLVRLVHWTTSPECQIKWNPNKWALEKSGSFFGVFSLYWQDHTTVLSYFFIVYLYNTSKFISCIQEESDLLSWHCWLCAFYSLVLQKLLYLFWILMRHASKVP